MRKSTFCSKEWVIPSIVGMERPMIEDAASLISSLHPGEPRIEDMQTALAEACLNAFEHGNRFDPERKVKIRMQTNESMCLFQVFDLGDGLSAMPAPVSPAERWHADHPRGWGLYLITSLCDKFEYGKQDGHFRVTIIFNLTH